MKWREFDIGFCNFCESTFYHCDDCGMDSCSCSGCEHCLKHWVDWQNSNWYKIRTKDRFEEEVFSTIKIV